MARQESHPDEGTAELNESLALHADSPHVLAKLGEIYMVAHKYSEAALCLDHAVALDRDNYAANFGLLQLYARTNDQRRDQQFRRFDEIK